MRISTSRQTKGAHRVDVKNTYQYTVNLVTKNRLIIKIMSNVILLPSAGSFKKGCCHLQAKVCARITGSPLVQACPGKSVAR